MISQKIIRFQLTILIILIIMLIRFNSTINIIIFSVLQSLFFLEYAIGYFYYRNPHSSFEYSVLPKKRARKRRILGYHLIDDFSNVVTIQTYYQSIWRESNHDIEAFIDNLIFITVLERICAERQLHNIKIKHCDKPFCKMWRFCEYIMNRKPNIKTE